MWQWALMAVAPALLYDVLCVIAWYQVASRSRGGVTLAGYVAASSIVVLVLAVGYLTRVSTDAYPADDGPRQWRTAFVVGCFVIDLVLIGLGAGVVVMAWYFGALAG